MTSSSGHPPQPPLDSTKNLRLARIHNLLRQMYPDPIPHLLQLLYRHADPYHA